MRLIYVNSSKVTKLEQKMNNSESFLLLLKNLLKCTYQVLLPSQRYIKWKMAHLLYTFWKILKDVEENLKLTSPQPLNNTVHYNMVLVITQDISGPQMVIKG